MYKLSGETGDGLATLGVRSFADGTYGVKAVSTQILDEPPFNRKAGMGGPRYLRHCLESAILNRGGAWLPPAMEQAAAVLGKIDGPHLRHAIAERWLYKADGEEKVALVSEEPWVSDATIAFEHRVFPEKDADWALFQTDSIEHAKEELSRNLLIEIWDSELSRPFFEESRQLSSSFSTGLLGRQALLERQFLVAVSSGEDNAWPLFHEMVSARYIRTLCLLHRCEKTEWKQEILWPEITELGRTILLLSCCGWLKEANELAHRARHMILSHQNQFVPLVPWFGIVWGTQNPDILEQGAVAKFHQPAYEDIAWILHNWKGDDLDGLADRLARVADRRRWMMGQFDDEYHIDFDDGFSWTIPYEVGAVLMARKVQGLPVPAIDHPIFELPTARFELAPGPVSHYQDIYTRFIREV